MYEDEVIRQVEVTGWQMGQKAGTKLVTREETCDKSLVASVTQRLTVRQIFPGQLD